MRVIRTERANQNLTPSGKHFDTEWDQQMPTLQAEFQAQLTVHWQQTEQRIKRTAEAIFHELEKRPACSMRYGLRPRRRRRSNCGVGADGRGWSIIHDLVVAPALLTVLEAVSRAITEGYVTHRKVELRETLLEDTRQFVDQVYRPLLLRLSAHAAQAAGSLHLDAEFVRRLPSALPPSVRTCARKKEAKTVAHTSTPGEVSFVAIVQWAERLKELGMLDKTRYDEFVQALDEAQRGRLDQPPEPLLTVLLFGPRVLGSRNC